MLTESFRLFFPMLHILLSTPFGMLFNFEQSAQPFDLGDQPSLIAPYQLMPICYPLLDLGQPVGLLLNFREWLTT